MPRCVTMDGYKNMRKAEKGIFGQNSKACENIRLLFLLFISRNCGDNI